MTVQPRSALGIEPRALDHNARVLFQLPNEDEALRFLSIPFGDASVIPPGGDLLGLGLFDAVVVDEHLADGTWRQGLSGALRPGGQLIVAITPDGSTADRASTALDGLEWHGIRLLDGRPCAVLTMPATDATTARGDASEELPVSVRLAAARSAFLLAYEHNARERAGLRARLGATENALARCMEDRSRSELALLRHMELLVKELAAERRRHRGLRLVQTVLQRHRTGRVLLRPLRLAWRAARRLRRAVRRGPGRLPHVVHRR